MEKPVTLHHCSVNKSSLILNRFHILLHTAALICLFYYRAYFLLQNSGNRKTPTIPYLVVIFAEVALSFIWLLGQAFRWRPVSRSIFPERLPDDEQLPAIDVFICTVDLDKEPTVEVMNTVISAMAMDYPPDKLFVYLSDDGGSSVTSSSMNEAFSFAKCWIPFCRNYGIKTSCPKAYFAGEDQGQGTSNSHISWTREFVADEDKVKENYIKFKKRVEEINGQASPANKRDHSTVIQVINDKARDESIPTLIYVSRERRISHPHHFKAGALNALLRVSGLVSNSPYILMLDCDMYCNDPTSARQAMCFHLDPHTHSSLAFVQFPQKFHNFNETNDIYDGQMRVAFKNLWPGMDGIEGPCLSGTCFYMKRVALYGASNKEEVDIMDLKHSFGSSNELIKSLGPSYIPNHGRDLKEAEVVASCAYEEQTRWGEEVGFMYFSVVEDYFTDLKNLHGKGWTSIYCDPSRPAFKGSCPAHLGDKLVQGTRWMSGLCQVGLSRFNPIIYGPNRMSLLQSMCYAWLAFKPLSTLPLWCLATIPQLCLLSGIPLYPGVSSSFFVVFPFIFLSSNLKQIEEILSGGDSSSIKIWINEMREWMMSGVSSLTFGCLDAILEKLGLGQVNFVPTNKAMDDGQAKLYQKGLFDFRVPSTFIYPMVTLVVLNIMSLIGGVTRAFLVGNLSEMLIQILLPSFILVVNYPIVEGMVIRKDKGRISSHVSLYSSVFAVVFLLLSPLILL